MTLGVFGALEKVLGLYSNVAIAWVGALVADLVINKPLGLSPKGVEFRRAYLYDVNPVGLGAMLLAVLLSIIAHAGLLGDYAAAFSPFIALLTAMVAAPLLAWATRGRYYLARHDASPWRAGEVVRCSVCENQFESADMATCPAYGAPICSLCCSLESRCHDRCKTGSRFSDQLQAAVQAILPLGLNNRFNFRVAHYLAVFLSLCGVMAFLLGVVYVQESLQAPAAGLRVPFIKAFSLLAAAVGGLGLVGGAGQREPAHGAGRVRTPDPAAAEGDRRPHAHRRGAAVGQGSGRGRQPGQDPLRGRHDARAAHAAQQHPGLRADPAAQHRAQGRAARGGHHHPAKRPAHARADRRPARPGAHRGRPPAPGHGAPAVSGVSLRTRAHGAAPGRGQGPELSPGDPWARAGLGAGRCQAPAPDPHQPAGQRRALHRPRRHRVPRRLPARRGALRGAGHRHRHCTAGPGAHLHALRARQCRPALQRVRHRPGPVHHPSADRAHGRRSQPAQRGGPGQHLYRAAARGRDCATDPAAGADPAPHRRLPGAAAHAAGGGRPARSSASCWPAC